ncbi:MAG: hypothetical protein SFW62_09975 [Alphaproteobacteria bacterium]|nr:hypothetical protein [Alphaproteobacteria bacterium]
MASTRAITRIKSVKNGFAALYGALVLFALINLFWTLTPAEDSNAKIDEKMQTVDSLPVRERLELLTQLRQDQESNLTRRPSEPYGWARLSRLRSMTQGDAKAAFAALQMSDLVSPYEAAQMPERAIMWYKLRGVQTPEQRAYQDILWKKAYGFQRKATWTIAVDNNLIKEVGESLKKTEPSLYEEWKTWDAMRSQGKTTP